MSFGKKLRMLRRRKGLTQSQLSAAAGVPQTTISALELDTNRPSWSQVQSLADALGVSCDQFRTTKPGRATDEE